MRVVTLLPLSKRAKQIVKQNGDRWEVVRKELRVLFSERAGPWLYLQPLSEERAPADTIQASKIDSAARWVNEFNDEDFKVAP